nr:MAG TPA: hypothetical protein [Caudoviricetes sp.]DAQ49468.1 MAG TPA: hypothetical protein [Caudoviricetes sp.]
MNHFILEIPKLAIFLNLREMVAKQAQITV